MVKHHNRVRFKSGYRKAFREPAAESCAAASFGLDPNGPTSKKQRIAPKNLDCQVPATKKHSRRKGKLQIGAKVIRIHPISSNWQISVRYQAANNGSPLPHKPERQATEAAHHGSDALHHWNQQWKTSNGQHIRHIPEFLEFFNLFLDHLGSSWIQFQHHKPACSNEEFSAVRFCMHDLGSEPMKKFVLASHCIPSFCVSKCVHIAVKSKITSQDQHHLTQLQYPAISWVIKCPH
jgi:hypothetical protein